MTRLLGINAGREMRDGFRLRGSREPSRLEGLTDAVFGFAITLLVVSLEVPRSFDQLVVVMRGFLAFAICFALLIAIWRDHRRFFLRYGLQDGRIEVLNYAMLFVVLFYVYPLKFLFTMIISTFVQRSLVAEMIRAEQVPLLMTIYGIGFAAISLIFALMYQHALKCADTLELSPVERLNTKRDMTGFFLQIGIAAISVVVANLPFVIASFISGMTYSLIGPVMALNGRRFARRKTALAAE